LIASRYVRLRKIHVSREAYKVALLLNQAA
jgi:hypothetical protein